MYSDNSVLTFGRYKHTRLCRVPSDYLLSIYQSGKCADDELKIFIKQNFQRINACKKGEPMTAIATVCEKFAYANEKIAKAKLREIEAVKQKHCKPVRAYQCEKCNGWHL